MDEELQLDDISNDLFIVNKYTMEKLFEMENCSDCIALYLFYYKTAKFQKTNQPYANDKFVKKALSWGEDRLRRTKNIFF